MVTSKTKLLIKNTSLNLAGYLYLLLASFISIPLLSRGLGEQFFAQYLLLAALPPIISVFDLGVSQAVIRSLSASLQGQALKVRSSSYAFFLANALILSLLTFAVTALVGTLPIFAGTELSTLVLLSLAASVFLNQLLTHFLALAQAENRFDIFNIKSFVVGTANTILAGLLAIRGGSLSTIFVVLFLSYLITLLLVVFFLDRGQSLRLRPSLNLPVLRSLLDYGLRSFVGKVSGQVELHAGKYILASSLSAIAVSAFSIPQLIMYRAAGAISQLALALFPLSSSLADPAYRHKLRRSYYRLQGGLLLLAVLGVLLAQTIGAPFLLWWLGNRELAILALGPLKILSYFFVLFSLTPIASTILDSLGYPHYTSFLGITNAALNVALLLLLTPRYSAVGAAYAALISLVFTVPVLLLVTEKVLQSNKLKY